MTAACCGLWLFVCCKDVRTCLLARSQSGDDLSGTRSNIVLDRDTAFRISRALTVVNPVFKV